MVVEVDGSQHMEIHHIQKDKARDQYLARVGFRVLRFNSREALEETDEVVEVIYRIIVERLNSEIPQPPL